MKRAALDRQRSVRAWRRYMAAPDLAGHPDRSLQPGHFRKGLRIGGCGNSGCRLCHAGKIDGYPTLQEWRHSFSYREQLLDAAV